MATISGKYATIRYTKEDIKSNAIPDFSGWMEQLRNFELNDRVVVNGDYGGREFHNAPGMVFQNDTGLLIGIEFDSDGYCWYVPAKMCKHEENPTQREEVMTTATGEGTAVLMGVDSEYGQTLTTPSAKPLQDFVVGSRVVINGRDGNKLFENESGTVIDTTTYIEEQRLGIEFDREIPGFHDADGAGRNNRCWYVQKEICSHPGGQPGQPETVFGLGDRVIIPEGSGTKIPPMSEGKIVDTNNWEEQLGIEFDTHVYGHTCDGKGRHGHCWYVDTIKCEPTIDWTVKPKDTGRDEIKVGSRVVINGLYDGKICDNDEGTVIEGYRSSWGIEFDRNINGHDCNGNGKDKHCFYIDKLKCTPLHTTSSSKNIPTDTEFSGLNWRKAEHLIKDRVFTSQDGSDWSPGRWTLERISQLPKTKFRYICSNDNRIREFSYIKK
jgi:hypothetical protein